MIRKRKTYSRPKRPFDKVRIDEEAKIKEEYGLKNKKELWKAEAKIKSMREKAKKLISAGPEEQQALFDRLGKIGIKVNSITDILGLDKRDYLEQRLQTIVVKKMLARSMKSARQLITHKKVLVDGKMVSAPSYVVPFGLRDKITLKQARKKKVEAPKEVTEEKPVEAPVEKAADDKPDTAPAEDQVENKEEDKETQEEVKEDAKENA
jgi:small subunit ribosomal protein S4